MDIKEILSDLSQAYGVSGSEGNAAEVALNILRNYTANCYIDKSGNVIGEFGERRADCPYLMIDSHIDQVGLIVTSITEKPPPGTAHHRSWYKGCCLLRRPRRSQSRGWTGRCWEPDI